MSEVPPVSPELPSTTWRAILSLLQRLPQGALSRGLGSAADVRIPRPLRRSVIGTFARAVGINLNEAEKPVEEYDSINQFFVRRLKPGTRTWPTDPMVAASPVDGIVGQLGRINNGTLIQAKGLQYAAAALLNSQEEAADFSGGSFLTIYLSPRHYHRIHTPIGGSIPFARHVPGALLPVNEPAVQHIPNLFARNERVLAAIDSTIGRVAIVAVGAYNVGRISTAFDPDWGPWVSNVARRQGETRPYSPPKQVETGQEIMAFHLGSTVVLLFQPGVEFEPLTPGQEVRLGQPIARRRPG